MKMPIVGVATRATPSGVERQRKLHSSNSICRSQLIVRYREKCHAKRPSISCPQLTTPAPVRLDSPNWFDTLCDGSRYGGIELGGTNTAFRWGIERRLEFIALRPLWKGHGSGGDLMAAFGISINRVSFDLNPCLGEVPENVIYGKHGRAYLRRTRITPLSLRSDADRYVSQLPSIADGIIAQAETWIGQLPPFNAAPTPVRDTDAGRLRAVIRAIRGTQTVEVEHQPLSRSAPRGRWIVPHAIAFDGLYWHTRAYCFTHHCFKDVLLASQQYLSAGFSCSNLAHPMDAHTLAAMGSSSFRQELQRLVAGTSKSTKGHIPMRSCGSRWSLRLYQSSPSLTKVRARSSRECLDAGGSLECSVPSATALYPSSSSVNFGLSIVKRLLRGLEHDS